MAAISAGSAARAELAARPAFAGIRPTLVTRVPHVPYSGIAPTIVGRRDNYPSAGIRPTLVPRTRGGPSYGYGSGYGGYGGYDGTANADFAGPGIYPPAPGPIDAPPFALPAPSARCPQIIEIGGGLAHKVATRVVSGSLCRR